MAEHKSLVDDILKFCVDCSGELYRNGEKFECDGCGRKFSEDANGVWDFTVRNTKFPEPSIYDDLEFKRWVEVFRTQESADWYIYKNALFRFFSQAGHRLLGRRINTSRNSSEAVLEVGAGTGALLRYVDATNYVALDSSANGLAILKRDYPTAIAVCGSVLQTPFPQNYFPIVASLHVLEHLYFLSESLDELRRVLSPGGRMEFAIPTEGGLGFSLGRLILTGPNLRRKYGLDINTVMHREHINDASRVLRFLHMHFESVESHYWPLKFPPLLSTNALIYGACKEQNQ